MTDEDSTIYIFEISSHKAFYKNLILDDIGPWEEFNKFELKTIYKE